MQHAIRTRTARTRTRNTTRAVTRQAGASPPARLCPSVLPACPLRPTCLAYLHLAQPPPGPPPTSGVPHAGTGRRTGTQTTLPGADEPRCTPPLATRDLYLHFCRCTRTWRRATVPPLSVPPGFSPCSTGYDIYPPARRCRSCALQRRPAPAPALPFADIMDMGLAPPLTTPPRTHGLPVDHLPRGTMSPSGPPPPSISFHSSDLPCHWTRLTDILGTAAGWRASAPTRALPQAGRTAGRGPPARARSTLRTCSRRGVFLANNIWAKQALLPASSTPG